jgi:phage terminase large subunit-like protein
MFNHIQNASDHLALSQGCYFDEAEGLRPIEFIERFCRQSKGRWAGKPLKLMEWQRSFIIRLFGWRAPDGKRRFRTAYLEVAKKNGKSTMISALVIYLLLGDNEGAPEVYLNAVDREQASIVFDEAARMVGGSPLLSRRLEVIKSKKRITDPIGHGKIQANSADAPSKDGVNASAAIFDELHRFKTRELWDVFEYAGASREQPLRIVISTAGEEEEGPWFEQREYSEKVNEAVFPDVAHLGVIHRALPDDDFDDPATWRKANPSLGVTINEDDFQKDLAKARNNPAELGNFLRLRLNIVARGAGKFIELSDWDACDGLEQASAGAPCYMGLDLSDRNDLTALVSITGDFQSGFDVECRFWLPRENIAKLERQHQVPYRTWADQGYIILTDGNTIDYDSVKHQIVDIASERNLIKLLSDPYNAKKLAEELLNNDGLPVEYVRQGYLSLSDPTKTLHELIMARKIRHGGDPILRWHASNAVVRRDPAGNIKLDKEKSRRKIDAMAALVNAVAGAISHPNEGDSVYEKRGPFFLSY